MEDEFNVKKLNRNRRHIHAKDKYKGDKAAKVDDKHEEKSNVETTLPNNWSKYEVTETIEDNLEGADFGKLLNQPESQESHFKFKSELNWDTIIKPQRQFIKYFTLDLKLLSHGIECVAFHKRLNCNEDIFNLADYNSFENDAKMNLDSYKKLIKNKPVKKIVKIKEKDEPPNNIEETHKNILVIPAQNIDDKFITTKAEESLKTVENVCVLEASPELVQSDTASRDILESFNDDVEDLLNIKTTKHRSDTEPIPLKAEVPLLNSKPTQKATATSSNKLNDLEAWLDDILDD